jgi:hypothetical protein
MDWTYPDTSGPEGLFEIGQRLSFELGRIPDATTFTNDAREMLRITRRVEAVARGGRLLVGFQKAAKLDAEEPRYQDLIAAGTDVVAFGSDRPARDIEGLEYREQVPSMRRLENQWFLVSQAPEQVAFASWEISEGELFGTGGAATEGKRFVGFITDDTAVVAALADYLEGVEGLAPPPPPPASRLRSDPGVEALAAAAGSLEVVATTAGPGAVVVPVKRDDPDDAVRLAIAIARAEGRRLVVVDRSAEGFFTSPYSDMRGDDSFRPQPDRLFDAAVALREGRSATARAITAADLLGVTAGGWFPTSAGADGLREALTLFDGSLIVLPARIRQPSVGERIRGMTEATLARLGVPLLVAE